MHEATRVGGRTVTTLRSGESGTPLAALLPRTAPTSGVPTRTLVGLICAVVVAVRLIYVWQPLRSDEGGYLLIARSWDPGGEFLYGDYHVDRPPLLMAIFRLAALSEWDGMIRLISIPFVLVAVVAAARAAYLVAGDRAARWSALVAGALLSSPALADQANGALFAVSFVMVSVALAVDAWERPSGRSQMWLALGAGAFGAAAWLVKQNFLDGLVFVAGLVVAEVLRRRRLTPRGRTLAVGAGVGALVPNVLAALWAWSTGVGLLQFWTEVVAFRGEALAVILDGSMRAPTVRGVTLVALALVSGLVPLLWTWLGVLTRRTSRLSPVAWGLNGMLVFGLAALVAGGSYWPHYLLQLVPVAALVAGMVAASDLEAGQRMRWWARFSAGSALVAAVISGVVYLTVPAVWFHERTGEWLAESSLPGDTAFVAYGSPSVLEAADLSSPYPFVWSLPMRTLDAQRTRLLSTMAGDDAPTWVVQLNSVNSWRIDEGGDFRDVLRSRYSVAATVCGRPVWLRDDLDRTPAPPPRC